MNQTLILTAFCILASSTIACGSSPLLHHQQAQAQGSSSSNQSATTPTGTCPLEFTKTGLCASLTWDSAPSTETENAATLRFWNKADSSSAGPFNDADGEVAISLWMPAMGHGSSPVSVAAQGSGVYSATRIYFIMPGIWDVRVQIKKNHQVFDQAQFSIKL